MTKLWDVEIAKPMYLTYMKCLETGRFPSSWKKANVLPIHKKENRQLKKNYRPISLLLTCGKIFENLCLTIFTSIFVKTNFWHPVSLDFAQVTQQYVSITHKIHSAFDEFLSTETRAIFLDMCKAFDKVWHDGLLFKLKTAVSLAVYLPFL